MITSPQTKPSSLARGRGRGATSRFAMVDVFENMEEARDDWGELAGIATTSPYQSFCVLATWWETIGRKAGVAPLIVVARDAAGRPEALIPLCVKSRVGLRIATFMGGRESNFNLPLIRPAAGLNEASLRALLLEAANAAKAPPDLFYLRNQPRDFDGFDNPLAFADARPSASFAYGATLPATAEELAARQSKDARKKLRRKEARLAEIGELRYEHCATGVRARIILDALIEQKSARLTEMGVPALSKGARNFLRGLSPESGDGPLELHGLSVAGRVVAAYAGFSKGERFSAMINSFDSEEEIARSSPGDLLLHAVMRNLVARGMRKFDLGAGEARYKSAVCDETIELCDGLVPVSRRGVAGALLFSTYLQLKRHVKQSPVLAVAHARLRRALRRNG